MNVSNKKCVRRLGVRSMRAAKSRNLIAVLAIALTTVLFTALFTIAMSLNYAFQQANFRQIGGYSHGGFKYLTAEQVDELKGDPLIREYGLRRFVGMPSDAPFNKTHVEVGYSDPNNAKWMYVEPTVGHLPAEGTQEAATDTRVLELLGIEPELGAEFTMTFDVDGKKTTQSFLLSGWWAYDGGIPVSNVLVPVSRAEEIFRSLGTEGKDGMTTLWTMDVMLGSSLRIERDLDTIRANHGYSGEYADDNFVAAGVNWGYTGAQLSDSLDPGTIAAMAALLLVIVFTGYLIIYNVFQISVTGDIRFYGLLKTIGTTGRQIRRMIRIQALTLSLIGIPLGLLAGYGVGVGLTPIILARLNGVAADAVSASPLIFLGAAAFSLATVLISCRKPGRMAAKVSPVDAVRYTEATGGRQAGRGAKKAASLPKMAFVNLGRNRKKTVITVISLALAVVLLHMTFTFANGFDMDKYVSRQMIADFILGDAGYFQVSGTKWNRDMALPEEVIRQVESQSGVTGGRTYGQTMGVEEFVSEEYFRANYAGMGNPPEVVDRVVAQAKQMYDGGLTLRAQVFGMESYVRGKLTVMEGDLSLLDEPDGRYIAAVYREDDYGVPHRDSHWAKLGDKVAIRYVEEYEYIDPNTGEILPNGPEDGRNWEMRPKVYHDVEYEVAALVTVPHSLGYRFYGADQFVLNAETFQSDTGTGDVMYYAMDTTDEASASMEAFLADYTKNVQPQYDYESKASYAEEFRSFQSMFLILGGMLSLIIGLVGILNFLNTVLAGILTRRREFAVLQSIGMTGKQLQAMLVWEGLYYTLVSVAVALLLCVAMGPLVGALLGDMFWFFAYHFTVAPVLAVLPVFALLGAMLPLLAYRVAARRSLIERLREAEM